METIKVCDNCGADISDRAKNARYCIPCANASEKESKAAYNKMLYDGNREEILANAKAKREAKRNTNEPVKKGRPKSHKPKPTSCIRAITPVASELGTPTANTRKEDRVREITPSPVLAEQPFRLRPNKGTWLFPKTQKRFDDLTQ